MELNEYEKLIKFIVELSIAKEEELEKQSFHLYVI